MLVPIYTGGQLLTSCDVTDVVIYGKVSFYIIWRFEISSDYLNGLGKRKYQGLLKKMAAGSGNGFVGLP